MMRFKTVLKTLEKKGKGHAINLMLVFGDDAKRPEIPQLIKVSKEIPLEASLVDMVYLLRALAEQCDLMAVADAGYDAQAALKKEKARV